MKTKLLFALLMASCATASAEKISIKIPYPVPTESEQRRMAESSFCVTTENGVYNFRNMSSYEQKGWKRVTLGDGIPPNYVGIWKAYLPEGREVMAEIDGKIMIIPMKVAHPCYITFN